MGFYNPSSHLDSTVVTYVTSFSYWSNSLFAEVCSYSDPHLKRPICLSDYSDHLNTKLVWYSDPHCSFNVLTYFVVWTTKIFLRSSSSFPNFEHWTILFGSQTFCFRGKESHVIITQGYHNLVLSGFLVFRLRKACETLNKDRLQPNPLVMASGY